VLQLEHITFSCDERARIAEFWGRLLDYEIAAAGTSWFASDPGGEGEIHALVDRLLEAHGELVPALS